VDVQTPDGAPADAVLRCRLSDLVATRRDDVALVGALEAPDGRGDEVLRAFGLALAEVSGRPATPTLLG
jgi:hypothetical protein